MENYKLPSQWVLLGHKLVFKSLMMLQNYCISRYHLKSLISKLFPKLFTLNSLPTIFQFCELELSNEPPYIMKNNLVGCYCLNICLLQNSCWYLLAIITILRSETLKQRLGLCPHGWNWCHYKRSSSIPLALLPFCFTAWLDMARKLAECHIDLEFIHCQNHGAVNICSL